MNELCINLNRRVSKALSMSLTEHFEGCMLIGRNAVYRRIADNMTDACGQMAPEGVDNGSRKESAVKRGHFEKSESEDSGVELPPPSPSGSESSYSPEEPESVESSSPEDPDSPNSCVPEEPVNFKCHNLDKTGILVNSDSETTESIKVLTCGGIAKPEVSTAEHWERDMSELPQRLEQAVLRSKRQRGSGREHQQGRVGRYIRHHPSSLKSQLRGSTLSNRARSPPLPAQEKEEEEEDYLPIPGDGLRYLENLCHMMEQIAELQQRNLILQREKREAEETLRNRVNIDPCTCGSSQTRNITNPDTKDSSLGAAKHYRKRSSSHTGVLWSLARHRDNTLNTARKMEPHFVSVPNLQEEDGESGTQDYKEEVSQWDKIKDVVSKFAQKASGSTGVQGSTCAGIQTSCRSQTASDVPVQYPRRLILPGLVIRPRKGRSFH